MAHRPQPDPKTLEEVHHLLKTTQFASIDDLLDRGEVAPLTDALDTGQEAERATGDSTGLAPLPKRR